MHIVNGVDSLRMSQRARLIPSEYFGFHCIRLQVHCRRLCRWSSAQWSLLSSSSSSPHHHHRQQDCFSFFPFSFWLLFDWTLKSVCHIVCRFVFIFGYLLQSLFFAFDPIALQRNHVTALRLQWTCYNAIQCASELTGERVQPGTVRATEPTNIPTMFVYLNRI